MITVPKITPRMSDVHAALSSNYAISPERRRNFIEAIHCLEKWSGTPLADLPASIPELAELIDRINPIAKATTPKVLAQTKRDCHAAIACSGLVPGVIGHGRGPGRLTPEWAAFDQTLKGDRWKSGLSRLKVWCNRRDVSPRKVDDSVIDMFMAELERTSEYRNKHKLRRATTRMWNEVRELHPGHGLQSLTVPPSRSRRTRIPMTEFPASFVEDWNAFEQWARGEDVFAPDARPLRLARISLSTMLTRVHLAANALVRSGVNIASIRGLADLVTIEAFRAILRQRHKEVNGEPTYENHLMAAQMVQLAREWVKVDAEVLVELKKLVDKQPRPIFELTQKNRRLVRQFNNATLVRDFFSVPERIWKEVEAKAASGRGLSGWDLAQAQAAIALSTLMSMPIRIVDLTALQFEENIVLKVGERSTLSLTLAKSRRLNDLEFDIPEQLAGWMTDYRERIAPMIMGQRPKNVFTNKDGTVKNLATVRYLVLRYLKIYLGVHMNPHAYRHLSAKFILDDSPGAYEVVQQLLGHKTMEMTATFYAGLNSDRAGRHNVRLLEEDIAATKGRGGKTIRPREQETWTP